MMIKVSIHSYRLMFRFPFRLSLGTRQHTDCIFVLLEEDGFTGYGEASLPPYLAENPATVVEFINSAHLNQFSLQTHSLHEILAHIQKVLQGNEAAKACLDIGMHDLYAKSREQNLSHLLNVDKNDQVLCTYTLGISESHEIYGKLKEGADFKVLKLKLGGENDLKFIDEVIKQSGKPFCVDVNQGWKTKEQALHMCGELADRGCLLVEQPLYKEDIYGHEWLKERSPLAIYADESIRVPEDLEKCAHAFHGINIKLMKCGGLSNAMSMAKTAAEKGLKILLGCMSESSCGVGAASHLSSLAHMVDLDGPFLISNDPFTGVYLHDGILKTRGDKGIGITLKNYSF